jgi:uncharacterized membrane protein
VVFFSTCRPYLSAHNFLSPARYLLICLKIETMEKKMFGIVLTVLGIAGLIAAAVIFMNSKAGVQSIKQITVYAILGAIFFFTGIGLIRTTKDRSV